MRGRLWFGGLGMLGKVFAIGGALYVAGWATGNLGLHAPAREFGSAGVTVLSVAVTGWLIRFIWTHYTRPSRYSGR